MKVLKESYGQFIEGTSAKQYLLGLVQDDDGFGVVALYSKIGAAILQINWKGAQIASPTEAEAVYDKALAEKRKYNFGAATKPAELDIVALVASHGRV